MPLNGHSSLDWQSRAFMRWLHGDRRLSRWLAKRWVMRRELLTGRPAAAVLGGRIGFDLTP